MSERLDWVMSQLGRFASGVHRLAPPAPAAATRGMPASLAALYQRTDGCELFHETLILRPAAEVAREDESWLIGELGRDLVYVDERGAVWRLETDTGELLQDGTSVDHWLAGWVDGESVLYDEDGEFRDDVVDESGESLVPAIELERARRVCKRDRKAPAPRWRLARALKGSDRPGEARDQLEELVASNPRFPWAWYDLARLAADAGDTAAAIDDAVEAATCVPDYDHAAFFFAYAARLAADGGDEPRRAALAARALELEPDLVRAQREGAAANLAEGALDDADALIRMALALSPKDLESLALAKRIASSR